MDKQNRNKILTALLELAKNAAEFQNEFGKGIGEFSEFLDTVTDGDFARAVRAVASDGSSDLLRLYDAVCFGNAKVRFPIGTIINDVSYTERGEAYEDPFIVVSYTNIRTSVDSIPKYAAVLLRKNVTQGKQTFSCANEWLNSAAKSSHNTLEARYGYLHYCSKDLQTILDYSLRIYIEKSLDAELKQKLYHRQCKFFLPSPVNLGLEYGNERELGSGTDDFRPWAYFNPNNIAPNDLTTRRISLNAKGEVQPYFIESRLIRPDNDGALIIDEKGQPGRPISGNQTSCAMRPACYIW